MQKVRVLIADDDVEQARSLGTALVLHGYACELVRTGTAALSAVVRGACDIVICDVRLGSSSDLELLDRVRLADKPVPVIILTTRGTTAGAVDAVKRGAFQYLIRPCEPAAVHAHLEAALAGSERHRRRPSLATDTQGEIVHESAVMTELLQTISLVAMSSAPVLIVGESGTGKELLARAIHERGPRAERAFVAINAAAIPEHLLESELFGHVRGAYTGAVHARAGLFAEADGGTILLDEIGDMPRVLQPKLLRVLQCGEIRPVGSDRTHRVDVRVIAATHRDLEGLIREGQFRDDLRYRLNTLLLRVPPLRERRADIAPLVQQFLTAARVRMPSSPVTSFSDEAMSMLELAAWPGNVRELESAVERLVVLTQASVIQSDDLTFLMPVMGTPEAGPWPHTKGRHFTMREMSQHYIEWMLEQTRGDRARAAALLGIDVSTLYRRHRVKTDAERGLA
jgi:two-component system response regulator HydG